jgi:hypothetical protein
MLTRPLAPLDRVHERWRDPVLTALTALIAVMMFGVAPLQAAGIIASPGPGPVFVFLVAIGMLVISRSLLPILAIGIAVALLVTSLVLHHLGGYAILDVLLNAAGWLIIALAIVWVTARAVFGPGHVTYHRVIGAILLYLAVGLVFVALYAFVGVLAPHAFSGLQALDRVRLLSDMIYFSFVTLTTVGYGDIAPVHPIARSLCNLEAIFGQLYPATLLARLVTLQLSSR